MGVAHHHLVIVCLQTNMLGLLIAAVFVCASAQTFPPSIVVHPPAQTVATETKTVRFTCAAYGLPLPTIRWGNQDGEIVSNSNLGFQISTQTMKFGQATFAVSVLEIRGVNASTTGNYICQAENGVVGAGFSVSFATFALMVNFADREPAVLLEPPLSPQTVDHGNTVEAVCVAYGNPVPAISWSKVVPCDIGQTGECTREVTDAVYSSIAMYGDTAIIRSVLQLCNASQEDSGVYRCTAWNDIGGGQVSADSSDWSLTVNPERVTVQPTSTACTEAGRNIGSSDVQPYQIVVGIMAVVIVLLIVAIVVMILVFLFNRASGKKMSISYEQTKADNPIYCEPSELDHKTLIN